MLVLRAGARAEQDLEVDDWARADEAQRHVSIHGRLDRWLSDSCPDTLVGQVRGYRHADFMISSSLRSRRAPEASSSRCRRLVSDCTTRRSASLTVAFLVVVPRMLAACSRRPGSSSS